MGNLMGGSMFIEGRIASLLVYVSLYRITPYCHPWLGESKRVDLGGSENCVRFVKPN